jgi:outer membrane lipoprotein-sorting protein
VNFLKNYKWRGSLGTAILLVSCAVGAAAQGSMHWTAEGVLAMMDRSAEDFHTLSADIEHVKYTAVVKDTSIETGKMWMRRDGKMRVEIEKPDPRTILRLGDSLYLYNPKINRVEEYNLGKNRSLVDQYMRLGFGTRAEAIKKDYLVAVEDEQELDGRKTVMIELTPKSQEIRDQIAKIQMWIDEASWLPIQQKFFEAGSGDYFLFHYTNLRKNLRISNSRFKADWPKGVTKVKPRG